MVVQDRRVPNRRVVWVVFAWRVDGAVLDWGLLGVWERFLL